jgi:hypothetical protein
MSFLVFAGTYGVRSGHNLPRFRPPHRQRQLVRRIEKACGLSFSPRLRSDLTQATESFLFLEDFARTHEPLAKVKVILEAHDKAATRFFNELFAGPSAVSDAGIYAHHLIEENLKFTQAGKDALGLDAMLNLLRAFHIACNASLKQLNYTSSAVALQQEDAWLNWIRRLRRLSRSSNHRAPAAKIVLARTPRLSCRLDRSCKMPASRTPTRSGGIGKNSS